MHSAATNTGNFSNPGEKDPRFFVLSVYQRAGSPADAQRKYAAVGCSLMLCRPFVSRLWARRDASKPGKRAQRFVDRPAVWKEFSNVRLEKHHIRTLRVSRGRYAPYRVGKVVLWAHRVGIGG